MHPWEVGVSLPVPTPAGLTRECDLQGWYSRLCSPSSSASSDSARHSKLWPLSAYSSYSLPHLSSGPENPAQPAGPTFLNLCVLPGKTPPTGGLWLVSSLVSSGEHGHPIPSREDVLTITILKKALVTLLLYRRLRNIPRVPYRDVFLHAPDYECVKHVGAISSIHCR